MAGANWELIFYFCPGLGVATFSGTPATVLCLDIVRFS